MEYKILKEDSPLNLEVTVENHLKKGYKLEGGVSYDSRLGYYLQAVTLKYKL